MRHRKSGYKLNRNLKHRKALFKNLIKALILNEEIKTTESKARAIKGLVDKLITKGKKGTLHARRAIAAFLQERKLINKVVDELGPRFSERASGFTRIVRIGKRRGDAAFTVKMEFVEKAKDKQTHRDKTQESVQKQTEKKTKKTKNLDKIISQPAKINSKAKGAGESPLKKHLVRQKTA